MYTPSPPSASPAIGEVRGGGEKGFIEVSVSTLARFLGGGTGVVDLPSEIGARVLVSTAWGAYTDKNA